MRIQMKTAGFCLAAALAVTPAAAACGGTHTGAAAQHSALKSAEANSSVEAAIAKAKRDVINPCIDGSSGVSSFISCVKGKVPRAQRRTVGKCLVKAALADKKGHSAYQVEQALISTDGPRCVAPALP